MSGGGGSGWGWSRSTPANGMREREVSGRKVVFEISTKILSLRYLSLFLYALYGTLSTSLRCTRLLLVELLLQPLGDELLGELVRVRVKVRVRGRVRVRVRLSVGVRVRVRVKA